MSFDVHLMTEVGGREPVEICEVGNITYNLGPMFKECLPGEEGLAGLHGMVAWRAGLVVPHGLAVMLQDRRKYEAMNPENGWGDYEAAIQFLFRMAKLLSAHPYTTVRIS